MHLLFASLLPLFLGPLLVWVLQRARWAARALDAFVLVTVAGLVLLSILPQTLADAGVLAIIAVVAGTALPMLGGKVFSAKPSAVRSVTVLLGLIGLGLHAALDGVALAAPQHGHDHGHPTPLAVAVLLHRFPVGLAIWWLVRPKLGTKIALSSVGAIAVATALGFVWAHEAHGWMHGPALGVFQALVAGSLLHVAVGHSAAPKEPENRWRIASAIGGAFGAAAVIALAQSHPLPRAIGTALTFGETFAKLAERSAPALLLAFVAASALHIALPDRFASWLRGGSSLSQAFRGVSAGIPTTDCSCNISPRYESLVRGGIPPSAAIAFLVATPEIGVVSIAVSFALLGPVLTVARVGAAILLAITVGLLLGRALTHVRCTSIPPPPQPSTSRPITVRIGRALQYGFVDVADRILPWYVAGLLVASLVEPMLPPLLVAEVPSFIEVPLFALLGLPLYVCAAGSTPLAAVMIHKGLSVGAAVAFLLTGPATNIGTFSLLTRLHGRTVAIVFGIVLAVSTIALGVAINLVLPNARVSLHTMATPQPLALISVVVVGIVFASSLLRQGTHGFVSRVVQLHGHHHHAHHTDDPVANLHAVTSSEARHP